MKKAIWLSIAAFFIFGLTAWGATATGKREKIDSPDQIKNYRDIIKRGDELFGVLANKMEDAKKREDVKRLIGDVNGPVLSGVRATSSLNIDGIVGERGLEKILAPEFISTYEKIQKIGTSLWGIRKGSVTASSSPLVRLENATCVVAAIDTKDKAVMSLVTSSAVGLNAAISVRSACQQKAVQSTEQQKAALEACIKDFRTAQKNLRASSKRSQQEIWSVYRTSLKNCQRSAGLATSTKAFEGELLIEDGGNDFIDTAVDSQAK